MSKRFGRNQKRRMREQIAQLEQSVEMDRALLTRQSRKIGDYESFVQIVGEAVGREAVISGKPTLLKIGGGSRHEFQMIPRQPPLSLECLDSGFEDTAAIRVEIMRLLNVKAIRDSLSRQMHVRVQFADGNVGYAMSDCAIDRMSEEELIRVIVPEISRLLMRQLKGSAA